MDNIKKKFHKIKSYNKQFCSIFGLQLSDYHDILTGFDICKFDKDIDCPDGISLKDWIKQEYGDNAALIIEQLI